MRLAPNCKCRRGFSAGFTLTELMVAIAIGAVVMAAIGSFSLYSLRSFVAMANYVDLDEKGRRASDEMTRQVRQSTAVFDFKDTGITLWLTLTNSTPGAANKYVKYTWDKSAKVLSYERTGLAATPILAECDNWEFEMFQRTPIPGLTNQFYPATNKSGNIDKTLVKLVDMKWRCTREILGKTFQTESVQTTKIVLRNH